MGLNQSVMCIYYEKACLGVSTACTLKTSENCDEAERRKELAGKDCPIMNKEACQSVTKSCDMPVVRQITPIDIQCYDHNIPGGCWLRKVLEVARYISKDSTLRIFNNLSHDELIELRNRIIEAGRRPNSPVYASLNLAKYFSPAP